MKKSIACFLLSLLLSPGIVVAEEALELNDLDYYEATGVNVIVFSNWYDGLFSDSKISGIELIHHGVRTATNGDVRLHATPEQWDRIPEFVEKKVREMIREVNSKLVDYKKIKDVKLRNEEFVKTTTSKIKRYVEENKG